MVIGLIARQTGMHPIHRDFAFDDGLSGTVHQVPDLASAHLEIQFWLSTHLPR